MLLPSIQHRLKAELSEVKPCHLYLFTQHPYDNRVFSLFDLTYYKIINNDQIRVPIDKLFRHCNRVFFLKSDELRKLITSIVTLLTIDCDISKVISELSFIRKERIITMNKERVLHVILKYSEVHMYNLLT